MSNKLKGYVYGVIAAVSYGMNPLGALYLYQDGINVNSVLFYRYMIAIVMLVVVMLIQKQSFRISKRETGIIAGLGIMFSISSITLFDSFNYMDAGIASTLLFVYPIMVAVLMALFFKEKVTIVTATSIGLALCGVLMLYQGDGNTSLNLIGVMLVMASSLSYAFYIIGINKASLKMTSLKLTFYVLVFGLLTIVAYSSFSEGSSIQLLTTPSQWIYASILALFPTVISLIYMTKAINAIGSTPAAIMGALEPVTAVFIGVFVFGEIFTMRLGVGILMILTAVILIIIGKQLSFRHIFHSIAHTITPRSKH